MIERLVLLEVEFAILVPVEGHEYLTESLNFLSSITMVVNQLTIFVQGVCHQLLLIPFHHVVEVILSRHENLCLYPLA